MNSISPKALSRKLVDGEDCRILDVRTPAEYAAAHIAQAFSQPLESFNAMQVARQCSRTRGQVYVICESGSRARKAISELEAAGLSECVLVEGGMSAWSKSGLPIERAPVRVISLERQVRIAAGTLVFTGTLLGAFLHPAFLVIPGFVGAGLVFAGISDICGMAMLLARMPWNQRTPSSSSTCNRRRETA